MVKTSASPKRPFFFLGFSPFSEHPVQGKFLGRPKGRRHVPKMPPPRSTYVKVIILLIFLTEQYQFLRTLPYVTVIKEPINTTSDGTFLSVPFCQWCVKTQKKCCWPKVGGAVAPPAPPPRNYPPAHACVG